MIQADASSTTNVSFSAAAAVIPLGVSSSRLIVAEPAHRWRFAVTERLEELIRLPVGWDGYAAEPVSLLNANFALRMLEAVCGPATPIPQIVPGSSADLQIEWHTPQGQVELHVRRPNDVLAWRFSASTPADGEELALTNNFIQVAGWIEELELSGAATAAA